MQKWSWIALTAGLGLWLAAAPLSRAQDPDTLAGQASTALRAAERSMFSGKLEEAQGKLEEAAGLIQKLKAEDPEHRNLKTLESKYEKVRRDLERRLPKPETAEPESPPKSESPGASAALPAGAAKRIRDIDFQLEALQRYLEREHPGSPDTTVRQARLYLTKANDSLAEIESRYGGEISPAHPEMEAVRKRVAEAEKNVDTFAADLAAGTPSAEEAAAPSGDAARALKDGERVKALYTAYYDKLSLIHGNTLVYGPRLEDAEAAWKAVEEVETGIFPELQPVMAELAERYGTRSLEIDRRLFAMGVKGSDQFGSKLQILIESARKIVQSRAASAVTIATNAKYVLDDIDRLPPDMRVERMQQTKSQLLIGQKLEPGNPEINDMLADIDSRIVQVAEKIERDIDSKVWAGHVKDFEGPGSVKSLAGSALDYFRGDSRWGKNPQRKVDILAVAVRGPWQVAERDIFGHVIQWRLPIHLAITDGELKAKKIARVYELSILAREGEGGNAPKAPPFEGYWVGSSWMIRLDKL